MDILLLPFQLFAFRPLPVFCVALFFGIAAVVKAWSRKRRLVLSFVSLIWLFYGIWEIYMRVWRSPAGDMAIRVDLVLFGPVLLVIAGVGLFTLFTGSRKKS